MGCLTELTMRAQFTYFAFPNHSHVVDYIIDCTQLEMENVYVTDSSFTQNNRIDITTSHC